jgi:large subunit ribosomal protein L6
MYGRLVEVVELSEGVTCNINRGVVELAGPLGTLKKNFKHTGITITQEDNTVVLTSIFPKKSDKAKLGSLRAHVTNMNKGVTQGFKYSMKIVFSHFPLKIEPQKDGLVKIENLYGGRKPRFAKIIGSDTKIQVDGEDVYVSGIDREAVGQTCANIQELTRQRGKRRQSPKTFMDGIFVYDKTGVIQMLE